MVEGHDVRAADGSVLRAYDTGRVGGPGDGHGTVLVWHHGSPQTGAPLAPLLAAAAARGIRLVSYARPSYGGSHARPGRDVASAAADVAAVADAFGIERLAVMGASGGGPHALACAALLPQRVTAAVTLAGLAPYTDTVDWYAGMAAPDALRVAAQGRDARAAFADEFDPTSFVPADYAALSGPWASLGADVGRSEEYGPDGLVDDDVAFAAPWGLDLAQVQAPVLLVHGGLDRVVPPAHARELLGQLPSAQLWLRPADGHVSVLAACAVAMDWVLDATAVTTGR